MLFSECGFYALSARKQLANLTSNLTPSTRIYQTNAITLSTLGMGKHNEHAADPVFIGGIGFLWGNMLQNTLNTETQVFSQSVFTLSLFTFQNFFKISLCLVCLVCFPHKNPINPKHSQDSAVCSLCFRRKTRYICDLTGSTFSTDAADAADAAAETGAGDAAPN